MKKTLRSPCETCAVEPGSIYCETCPGLKAYLEASKNQPAEPEPDPEPEGTDAVLARINERLERIDAALGIVLFRVEDLARRLAPK
jgi:hypothetical protein